MDGAEEKGADSSAVKCFRTENPVRNFFTVRLAVTSLPYAEGEVFMQLKCLQEGRCHAEEAKCLVLTDAMQGSEKDLGLARQDLLCYHP